MSLLKTNEIQNYNGSSLTLTASTVSTSAQLNTGGNVSVTGSLNVSDDSTTRSNLGLGTISTQDSSNVSITGGSITGTTIVPTSPFSFRNLLYNGAMQINQRGDVSVTSGNAYGCDRWQVVTAGGTAQYDLKQSTDVPSGQGFSKSFHIDVTTADTSMGAGDGYLLRQYLEGYDVQRLIKGTSNAKSLTLKFWVKSPKNGTHIVELFDNDNQRSFSQSYIIDAANTWQLIEKTFIGDSSGSLDNDNSASFGVYFWLSAGSNFSSGTLNTSWNNLVNANRVVGQVNVLDNVANNFYITGVQLEEGTATPFEHRPYGTELALCQRYYYRISPGAASAVFGPAYSFSTTGAQAIIPYPVAMRIKPTALEQNGTANNYEVASGSSVVTCSAVPTYGGSTTNYTAVVNATVSSGLTNGNGGALRADTTNGANAYLGWSAEL